MIYFLIRSPYYAEWAGYSMATQSSYRLELLCHYTFLGLRSKIKEFRSYSGKVAQYPNFNPWPVLGVIFLSGLDLLGLEVYEHI